ncbi:MAG: PH domain-containing protein [Candidatus Heimdallarchaeaceae archaeon]
MSKEKTTHFGVGKQKLLETFLPDKKYRAILNIQIFLVYFLIFWGTYLTVYFSAIAAVIEGAYTWAGFAWFLFYIMLGPALLIYLILVIFSFPYIRSLNYSFTTQEIVVNRGFINKKTKIVPYRNITNFIMKRGLLYRMIGGDNFGVILVETAGQGPQQKHPEQRIMGIVNVAEISAKIQEILSKMKGQAGISADTETASSLDEEEILTQILTTLKQIETKL